MKRFLTTLKRFMRFLIRRKLSERLVGFVIRDALKRTRAVNHGSVQLVLAEPGPQIKSRNLTFSSKEPGTLEWIDSFPSGSELWDIGANVGLYSVYAAKKGVRVHAFEPSVFNLEFLARNINLNDVSDLITVFPVAVGGVGVSASSLNLSSTAWGDSQNSFGTLRGQFGVDISSKFKYRVIGVSLDALVADLKLAQPDFIKIDVDGIEPEILESGDYVLSKVRGVLVECPAFEGGEQRVRSSLERAGLRLDRRDGRNEIWIRNL